MDLIAATLGDDYEHVLRRTFHDDAVVVMGGRRVGDRLALVGAREHTVGAGVGLRLRAAVGSRGLMLWETDFLNPPDDPAHCPPAVAWLHTVRGDRTQQLRMVYRDEPSTAGVGQVTAR